MGEHRVRGDAAAEGREGEWRAVGEAAGHDNAERWVWRKERKDGKEPGARWRKSRETTLASRRSNLRPMRARKSRKERCVMGRPRSLSRDIRAETPRRFLGCDKGNACDEASEYDTAVVDSDCWVKGWKSVSSF